MSNNPFDEPTTVDRPKKSARASRWSKKQPPPPNTPQRHRRRRSSDPFVRTSATLPQATAPPNQPPPPNQPRPAWHVKDFQQRQQRQQIQQIQQDHDGIFEPRTTNAGSFVRATSSPVSGFDPSFDSPQHFTPMRCETLPESSFINPRMAANTVAVTNSNTSSTYNGKLNGKSSSLSDQSSLVEPQKRSRWTLGDLSWASKKKDKLPNPVASERRHLAVVQKSQSSDNLMTVPTNFGSKHSLNGNGAKMSVNATVPDHLPLFETSEARADKPWPCPHCEFENDISKTECGSCGAFSGRAGRSGLGHHPVSTKSRPTLVSPSLQIPSPKLRKRTNSPPSKAKHKPNSLPQTPTLNGRKTPKKTGSKTPKLFSRKPAPPPPPPPSEHSQFDEHPDDEHDWDTESAADSTTGRDISWVNFDDGPSESDDDSLSQFSEQVSRRSSVDDLPVAVVEELEDLKEQIKYHKEREKATVEVQQVKKDMIKNKQEVINSKMEEIESLKKQLKTVRRELVRANKKMKGLDYENMAPEQLVNLIEEGNCVCLRLQKSGQRKRELLDAAIKVGKLEAILVVSLEIMRTMNHTIFIEAIAHPNRQVALDLVLAHLHRINEYDKLTAIYQSFDRVQDAAMVMIKKALSTRQVESQIKRLRELIPYFQRQPCLRFELQALRKRVDGLIRDLPSERLPEYIHILLSDIEVIDPFSEHKEEEHANEIERFSRLTKARMDVEHSFLILKKMEENKFVDPYPLAIPNRKLINENTLEIVHLGGAIPCRFYLFTDVLMFGLICHNCERIALASPMYRCERCANPEADPNEPFSELVIHQKKILDLCRKCYLQREKIHPEHYCRDEENFSAVRKPAKLQQLNLARVQLNIIFDSNMVKNAFELVAEGEDKSRMTVMCKSTNVKEKWVNDINQCVVRQKLLKKEREEKHSSPPPPAGSPKIKKVDNFARSSRGVKECDICERRFTVFVKKYTCSKCGQVTCQACTNVVQAKKRGSASESRRLFPKIMMRNGESSSMCQICSAEQKVARCSNDQDL